MGADRIQINVRGKSEIKLSESLHTVAMNYRILIFQLNLFGYIIDIVNRTRFVIHVN